MKKRSVVAAFAAVFLVLSTAGMVFASSLTLGSPVTPSLYTASKCATGSAEVMVSDGSAAVSVPEGCESVDLKLYVAENDQAHSVGFAPGTTVSLPAGFKAPKAALVTADTWPLATDLKVDSGPPIIDDEPFTCKVGSGICSIERQEILWGDGTVFGFTMAITSDSPTPVEWELSINLSSSWFPFVAGGLADQGGEIGRAHV